MCSAPPCHTILFVHTVMEYFCRRYMMSSTQDLNDSLCWYQLGTLGCLASRWIIAVCGSLVVGLVSVCAAISVTMMWACIKNLRWSITHHNSDNSNNSEDSGGFEAWLSSPTVTDFHARLRRSEHARPDGHFYGHQEHFDMLPSYEDVMSDGSLPTYAEAVGLNRVLPDDDLDRGIWV